MSLLCPLPIVAGLTCVLAAAARYGSGEPPARPDWIAELGIGSIRLGMTLEEARRALPSARFERTTDGDGAALVEVTLAPGETILLVAGEDDPTEPIDWAKPIGTSLYVTFEAQPPHLTFRLDYTGRVPAGTTRTSRFGPDARLLSIAVSADAEALRSRVERLLAGTPLVDGHNDLVRHFVVGEALLGLDARDFASTDTGQTNLARWRAADRVSAGLRATN